MEHGAAFMLQPMMDFSSGFCTYDCRECSEVCPTGAIKTVHPEEKKTIQIGIAKFVKENCVIDFGHGLCGDCAEVCPTNAITMVPDELGKAFPQIDETTCIGCGACEFICKARPNKAIYVEGNVQHQVAEKPKGKAKEQREGSRRRRRGRH
jgi:ferredoxin